MSKIYDVVIIGAGPAGITAGIYAGRAELSYAVLEKGFAGGQIINTYDIENYTGYSSISGFELASKMQEHLQYLGGSIVSAEVKEVKVLEDGTKEVVTDGESLLAKNVIVATGATARKLGVPGEEEFSGRGVSYCATCDGAFYKDKVTMVVGGGDVAVEDAIYLARMCKKVYVAHRRDELRAIKNLQTKLFSQLNVEMLWYTELEEIKGSDGFVNSVQVVNNQTKETSEVKVDGVFIAIGSIPNTAFLGDLLEKDETGCIVTDAKCRTNVEGIYAVGDLRSGAVRQIIVACADGVVALKEIDKSI